MAPRAELLRLLSACKAGPDDDHARLVLADWLEEFGDEQDRARAEFIRFQLTSRPEAGHAEFVLWSSHRWEQSAPRWAPFHSSRCRTWCRRGLVEAELSGRTPLGEIEARHADSEAWAWVELAWVRMSRQVDAVLSSPLLHTVASAHLSLPYFDAALASLLARASRPAWRALRVSRALGLSRTTFRPGALRPLVEAPALAGLRGLWLEGCRIPTSEVEALAGAFPALEELTLPGPAEAPDAWMRLLAGSSWRLRSLSARDGLAVVVAPCQSLRSLHLSGTCATAPLRLAGFWPTLEELRLTGAQLPVDRARELADCPKGPRLRLVSLSCSRLGDGAVPALAASGFLDRLDRLDLSHTMLGPQGAEALTALPAGPLHLNLSQCRIGDSGLMALARWPGLSRCRQLMLPGNLITDEGARALAESPYAVNLVGLNLYNNEIGDGGACRLVQGEWIGRVEMLLLGHNRITDAIGPALATARLGAMKELGVGRGLLSVRARHALAHVPFLR